MAERWKSWYNNRLTFATEGLQGRILQCRLLEDPDTIKDHTAIETIVRGVPVWKVRHRWS